MKRRQFLALAASSAVSSALLPGHVHAADLPRDLKITRITAFSVPSKRNRYIGKNSHLDDHKDRGGDSMLRIFTNQGIDGLGGLGRLTQAEAARLIGRNPFDLYDPAAKRMTLGRSGFALWDLLGKAQGKPVWQLLGGQGPARVPVYDGSIYFSDLLPQYAANWQDRFKEELDQSIKSGHTCFKVKIGRGYKWMPRAEGDRRDIEVVQLIRRHVGPAMGVAVDANNGYDLAGAGRFIEATAGCNLEWAEEMFDEAVAQDLALKALFRKLNLKTLIADGETQNKLEVYKPFIESKSVDVFEGDINTFGVDEILTEADWAKAQGLRVSPHGWGSFNGFFMSAQIGRGITNFYRVEQDPLANNVLIPEGYKIEGGTISVPETPGYGMRVNEAALAAGDGGAKVLFDLKA